MTGEGRPLLREGGPISYRAKPCPITLLLFLLKLP